MQIANVASLYERNFPPNGILDCSDERGMMVYFPQHKLLYASDMIQRRQDGSFFMPEYLFEVTEAVDRERLSVEKVFAMHTGLTDWSAIKAAIENARKY